MGSQPFEAYLTVQAHTKRQTSEWSSLVIISCSNLTHREKAAKQSASFSNEIDVAGQKQRTRHSNAENEELFDANAINLVS